jgi:Fe(3+) dicitrate transport protein
VDYVHKQGEGARENLDHRIDDFNVRFGRVLNDAHALSVRGNFYQEDSTVTYSGLTQAEFEQLGERYNPFENDDFDGQRLGASVTHDWNWSSRAVLTTSAYYAEFDRDWWRQSSTTTDTQCGAAFVATRLSGNAVDPNACNSVQGRLRSYYSWGIEPRLTVGHGMGEFLLGAKYHFEQQDRRQVNATSPTGRTGTLVESNLRETEALSAFVANRFDFGSVSVTPLVRHERVDADRTNRLAGGQDGATRVTRTLPGLGVTWNPNPVLTAFASAHRGFAPPRVEDLINGVGTATDVDAEDSLNLEAGLRLRPVAGLDLQAAYFHNDFDNLIAVGSIAGGNTPLSQGEALFAGVEVSATYDAGRGMFGSLAYTWLGTADQTTAFRNVANGAVVGVEGNRQPYAPRTTVTAATGYAIERFDIQIELQYVGSQFTDFANSVSPTADGQRGQIDAYTVLNLAGNYRFNESWACFMTVKNLGDKTYIVDRTRGIQVGQPRLLQAGIRLAF